MKLTNAAVKQLIDTNPLIESLFAPLYYKAKETERQTPIFDDPLSVEILSQIEFDFSYFDKNTSGQFLVCVRSKILDEQLNRHLNQHANLVVVNLGAGLDTRFSRCDSDRLEHWYDIDLPEVIDLREQVFQPSDKNTGIGKSVLDLSWCEDIDKSGSAHHLFIIEGLLMYFSAQEVKTILDTIGQHFPGSTILCEIFNKKLVNLNVKNAKDNKAIMFKWGIDSSKDIESLCDGLKVVNEWNMFDYHKNRQPGIVRFLCFISRRFKALVKVVELKCRP